MFLQFKNLKKFSYSYYNSSCSFLSFGINVVFFFFKVSELEPEDTVILQKLQSSVQEMMAEAFVSLPVDLLSKHFPNYDYHSKLVQSYRKIASAKARFSALDETRTTKNSEIVSVASKKRKLSFEGDSAASNGQKRKLSFEKDSAASNGPDEHLTGRTIKVAKLMPLPSSTKNNSENLSSFDWAADGLNEEDLDAFAAESEVRNYPSN